MLLSPWFVSAAWHDFDTRLQQYYGSASHTPARSGAAPLPPAIAPRSPCTPPAEPLTRALSDAICSAFDLGGRPGRSASSNPTMPSALYHVIQPQARVQRLGGQLARLLRHEQAGDADRIRRQGYCAGDGALQREADLRRHPRDVHDRAVIWDAKGSRCISGGSSAAHKVTR